MGCNAVGDVITNSHVVLLGFKFDDFAIDNILEPLELFLLDVVQSFRHGPKPQDVRNQPGVRNVAVSGDGRESLLNGLGSRKR